MRDLLMIIENESIETLMQLVISPNQEYAAGIEALSRGVHPETGAVISPLKLIFSAKRHGLLKELEQLMFKKALENFKPLFDHNNSLLLFINIDPDFIEMCIDTDWIDQMVEPYGIPKSNIFFDIQTFDFGRLGPAKHFVDQHREKGYYISIDDLGTEYNNLDKILYLNPDLVKINIKSLRQLENQQYVEKMIRVLKPLAENLGLIIVAKGIETEVDLAYAMESGAQYLQGYYISKPLDLTPNSLQEITSRYAKQLAAHVRVEENRLELTRSMTAKAYGVAMGVKAQLDLDFAFGSDLSSEAVFERFPMIENLWILNEKGVQSGPTIINHHNYKTRNMAMFQIYNEGSDFSSKDLFTQLYDTILDVWVTPPIKSVLTNNLCIGCSVRLDHDFNHAVLGVNINLDRLLALESEEERIKVFEDHDEPESEGITIFVNEE